MRIAQERGIIMTRPDPTTTKTAENAAPAVSAAEGCRHITTLLTLAGKIDGCCETSDSLRVFLCQNPDIVTMSLELLTSAEPRPVNRSFDQLVPQSAIDAYRGTDNRPLPGAEPRICQGIAHMTEIPADDVLCNASARHDYVQHILLPAARSRVVEAMNDVFKPDEIAQLRPEHLTALTKLAEALTGKSHSGSPCGHDHAAYDPVPRPYAQ